MPSLAAEFKDPFPMAKDDLLLNTKEKFLKAYGSEFADLVFMKADSPLETGTSGNLYQMVGAKLWAQMNTEENLWATFSKEGWGANADGYDGWRVITSFPTTKGYQLAEKDELPPDGIFGFDILFDIPKTSDSKFSSTELSYREAIRGQAVQWAQYVRWQGLSHRLYLCEQMALEVGDNDPDTGIVPLDQIVSSYSEYINCPTITAKTTDASQFYQATVDRSAAASWQDAYVMHNSEVLRPLTVNLLDDLITGLRQQCGIYSTNGYAFITGIETQTRLKQLLRAHKLFTNEKFQTNGSTGLRQVEGQGFGFNVNVYDNIPIIASRHLTDTLKPALGLTPIFLVYLPDITIWVDLPTVYTERGFTNGEDILMNAHKVTGLFHTMWDTHAYSFFKHAKLRDISE
jgi:hypothetical protein